MRASWQAQSARAAAAGMVAALALLLSGGALADDPDDRLEQARILTQSNATLAQRSQQALLELYALEAGFGRAERRLAHLEARAAELERQREAAEQRLELAKEDHRRAERALALRLRAIYIEGDVDPLAVLLGAESLDDAIAALDGLGRLASEDRRIVDQLKGARRALGDALRRLAARRADLDELVTQARLARDSLAAARSERAAYLGELARRRGFNTTRIGALSAEAAAIELRARELEAGSGSGGQGGSGKTVATAGSGTPPVTTPTSGPGEKLTVLSTGYCLRGTTATGMPVGPGVVAVDPSVIALGTRMTIPGYGGGVAADTGSAVKGAKIDLWFSSCAKARAWGSRTVTITLH